MKSGPFDKLEEALYIWLKLQRERGSPITDPILMEKASELYKLLYKTSDDKPFTASVGFKWRFCQRYGIRNFAVFGEEISTNAEAAKQFIKVFLI